MQSFAVFALILVATDASGVTPVQKVIQLLNGMVEKGKKEKNEEQKQFAAYKQFCDDTTVEKQRSIKEANEMIEILQADIQKYEADAAAFAKEIAGHDDDIATWEGDFKASSKVRAIEHSDYVSTHKDYTESIDALDEGIATLKKQSHDTKQAAASLMQLASKKALRYMIPADEQSKIQSFLSTEDGQSLTEAAEAPEANAYEFQSQGIVDMLSKLASKFEDERTDLEKEETSARQAFEMLSQDLKAQLEMATAGRTEKSEAKAKALQNSADAKGNLQDTTTTRDEDSKYLADLGATCEAKSSAFAERQQLRAEEIEAVEKAIEILSSGAVSGASEKHLPQLMQVKTSSLAQFRSDSMNPNQERVAAYLKSRASVVGSRILSALATRVEADPFKKVTKMIKDLIVKLVEEANEEAEQKGWCDTELSKNEQTRKEKTESVETLHAEIDTLEASISKLTDEITELTKEVAETDAAVAKATEVREEEKAKNTVTIKDAQDAQTAVAQALGVLKDFYAKAGEATALMQLRQPEVFDEPYKGMGGESGGVVGMIEVIQSDFARLESETSTGEAEAKKEYDSFMSDSSEDKAQKSKDIEHKSGKKQNDEQALQEAKTDLDGTQKELDAALTYYEKLKPSCVDAGESYEERVARRKEEIASLKEALSILNGESV
jgi:DNA repair exonuclease SbcCD ATPase subunit